MFYTLREGKQMPLWLFVLIAIVIMSVISAISYKIRQKRKKEYEFASQHQPESGRVYAE